MFMATMALKATIPSKPLTSMALPLLNVKEQNNRLQNNTGMRTAASSRQTMNLKEQQLKRERDPPRKAKKDLKNRKTKIRKKKKGAMPCSRLILKERTAGKWVVMK